MRKKNRSVLKRQKGVAYQKMKFRLFGLTTFLVVIIMLSLGMVMFLGDKDVKQKRVKKLTQNQTRVLGDKDDCDDDDCDFDDDCDDDLGPLFGTL